MRKGMSKMLRRLASLVALSIWSNGTSAAEVIVSSVESTVARIADREIALKMPEFDSVKFPAVVRDAGNQWEVDYKLPDGVIGGTPVVVIDKKTLAPVRIYKTQ
jgi:hypothetical protein